MAAEEQRTEAAVEEIVYRTKVVQFLGRATPIILQNDNGPCPLLAICNVLLLRNNLNLSLDVSEVSLPRLLSLVAERLIDSNSNVQDKDDGYVNNQQQNISDAIDLLPRLATGIDVNVHFRKINDFEFTRECAIFDLLDIGLYHGWIVDPQDTNTAAAIGSKSYNTLVAELVAFEARKSEGDDRNEEEDCVDFAAATTATLGVPSPSLSRGTSFDDQVSVPVEHRRGKGDIQEEDDLMRALNLSRAEVSSSVSVSMLSVADQSDSSLSLDGNGHVQRSAVGTYADTLDSQTVDESKKIQQSDTVEFQECNASIDCKGDVLTEDGSLFPTTVFGNCMNQTVPEGFLICEKPGKPEENTGTDMVMSNQAPKILSPDEDGSGRCCSFKDPMIVSENDQSSITSCSEDRATCQILENAAGSLGTAAPYSLQSSNGKEELSNVSDIASNLLGNEPIYEGEDCIIESGLPMYANEEPVYEGEMVLAEQAGKTEEDNHLANIKDEVADKQWKLIKSFLEHNASQLTIYGLFCLQEGLKERELCVFFRNNHFSTMFKFNGELYLLATDQGYMSQSDLVWEKLNEVNGDTVFMTGNFMEFNADNQVHADYLAALESSGHPSSALATSDMQLAMALQQQEYEQQPQRQQQQPQQQQRQQQQHSQQPPSIPGRSRLITGPQVSRYSGASQRSESKTKEKCIVM